MRTYSPKPGDADKKWYVIDATDVVLGRLAAQTAALLRGKHKPTFAPHMDMGDNVIIINADKVALTGKKLDQKMAYRHSGRPGGLTATPSPRRLSAPSRRPLRACFLTTPSAARSSRSCTFTLARSTPTPASRRFPTN